LDYLHYKASEILSLRLVAEDKVRQDRNVEIAKNLIIKESEDTFIADITGLTLGQIEEIRADLSKK
jgi:ribosomal protein L10